MATFELWNTISGNLVGTFATEEDALGAVRDAVERHGEGYGNTLALGRENSRGASRLIASGGALMERASKTRRSASPRTPERDARIA